MSRKDTRARVLKRGESQRKDGSYQYRYQYYTGTRHYIYSWRLVDSDRVPDGKTDGPSLLESEKEIEQILLTGALLVGISITLNQMFDSYIARK